MFVCNETFLPYGPNVDKTRLTPLEVHFDFLYSAADKVLNPLLNCYFFNNWTIFFNYYFNIQAKEIAAEQDYISTNYSDGIGNRLSFQYDLVVTDNYLETVNSFPYYMNLAASLDSFTEVINTFKIIFNLLTYGCK